MNWTIKRYVLLILNDNGWEFEDILALRCVRAVFIALTSVVVQCFNYLHYFSKPFSLPPLISTQQSTIVRVHLLLAAFPPATRVPLCHALPPQTPPPNFTNSRERSSVLTHKTNDLCQKTLPKDKRFSSFAQVRASKFTLAFVIAQLSECVIKSKIGHLRINTRNR